MRLLAAIDGAIGAVLRPVVFAGMVVLIGVITLQVVSRVFFTAVPWTEEAARFLVIWLTFLGAALAYHQRRHIAVTVLVERVPPRWRRALLVAGLAVICAFMVSMTVLGWQFLQTQGAQRAPALGWRMMHVYLILPLSAGLMAWLSLIDLARLLVNGAEPVQRDLPQ